MELENILGYEGHTNYLHLKKALLENILSDPESTHKYHIGTQYSMPAVFDKVHVVYVKHCQKHCPFQATLLVNFAYVISTVRSVRS